MASPAEDCDSVTLDLERDSTFLSQGESCFYLRNKSQIFEANECGVLNTYSLPEQCNCVARKDTDLYFAAKNRLYKLLVDGTFGEKRLRQRILSFLPLDGEYPLLALICKDLKMLQLQMHASALNLEKYSERCDASILSLRSVGSGMALCVYRTESVLKYCLVGIEGEQLSLIRKERLSEHADARFEAALFPGTYMLLRRDSLSLLALNEHSFSLDELRRHELKFGPFALLKLVNDYVLCVVRLEGSELVLEFYELYRETMFHGFRQGLDFKPRAVISMLHSRGMFKFLLEREEGAFVVVSFFKDPPTESITYHDPYPEFPSDAELERLIETSDVAITPKLVDHMISKGLKAHFRKMLRCPHIPELEAVKIVKNDLSLLEEFLLHTQGSDEEFKRAFRSEVDPEAFRRILDELFGIVEQSRDRELVARALATANVLLDAKVMDVEEFEPETLARMQALVEGCQKEHLDLQSLLSFTNTLLDSKFRYDANPLIKSVDISLD